MVWEEKGEFKGDKYIYSLSMNQSCSRVRTADHSRSVNDDVVRNDARSAVRTLQDYAVRELYNTSAASPSK